MESQIVQDFLRAMLAETIREAGIEALWTALQDDESETEEVTHVDQ